MLALLSKIPRAESFGLLKDSSIKPVIGCHANKRVGVNKFTGSVL